LRFKSPIKYILSHLFDGLEENNCHRFVKALSSGVIFHLFNLKSDPVFFEEKFSSSRYEETAATIAAIVLEVSFEEVTVEYSHVF
tara:strand:+ start:194 stop:448 length:255 start_codon:yes stop_codon:yes gene_type:complete